MWCCSAVMKALIFLVFCSFRLSSAVTHSLQYFYTVVTPGIHFPEFTTVGQVDGQQFSYYDSNTRRDVPKSEWMQRVTADDPEYWTRQTEISQGAQETYKVNIAKAMRHFNQTTGVHTVQMMYGCEQDDDGTTRGYEQHGYDGEDFLSFDLKTLTWIAAKPQAVITKHKLDPDTGYNNYLKGYYEKECIDWLKKHLSYGKEILERKVPPNVTVFQKHSPSPEVVCHTTGFFPKSVTITWQKDGQDMHKDMVDIRETLPNQDGSFQKRSILKVPAESLQKHKYTCVVQHSSLEKELVREVPKGGAPIAVIVGVVAALVALVAIIAGIVVWKKKNSGERRKKADVKRENLIQTSSNCVPQGPSQCTSEEQLLPSTNKT